MPGIAVGGEPDLAHRALGIEHVGLPGRKRDFDDVGLGQALDDVGVAGVQGRADPFEGRLGQL